MQRHCWMRRGGWVLGVALALAMSGMAWAQGPPEFPGIDFGPMEPLRPSEYWLGLECYPAQDALRAQLNLEEGQGLVVHQVLPESPAAKAGIQHQD